MRRWRFRRPGRLLRDRRRCGAGSTGGTGSGGGGGGGAGASGGEAGEGGAGGPIDVRGQVISPDGVPLLGALVFLEENYAEFAVTDAMGRFAIPVVEAPYSLTALHDGRAVHIESLGNPEPVIVIGDPLFNEVERRFWLSLEGRLTGAGIPGGPSLELYCAASVVAHCVVDDFDPTTGVFDVDLTVYGSADRADVVFATTVEESGTVRFGASGRIEDVELRPEARHEGLLVELDAPIETRSASVAVDLGVYDRDFFPLRSASSASTSRGLGSPTLVFSVASSHSIRTPRSSIRPRARRSLPGAATAWRCTSTASFPRRKARCGSNSPRRRRFGSSIRSRGKRSPRTTSSSRRRPSRRHRPTSFPSHGRTARAGSRWCPPGGK